MEHMVHSESDKYKYDLHDALKVRFGGKLSKEDFDFIEQVIRQVYIRDD